MKKQKEKQDLPIELLRKCTTTKLNPESGSLDYEVGKHRETGEAHLRISSNSSGGYYSSEWISVTALQSCVANSQPDATFSSRSLRSAFQFGKSANNASFLAAVLRHEGLLKAHDTKKFQHHLGVETNKWPEILLTKKPTTKSAVTRKSN